MALSGTTRVLHRTLVIMAPVLLPITRLVRLLTPLVPITIRSIRFSDSCFFMASTKLPYSIWPKNLWSFVLK